jgi:putative addiction module component (TIGR02574 family)
MTHETTSDKVAEAALRLSREDRAQLAAQLLTSLEQTAQDEIDAAWVEEAERRLAAVQRGELAAVEDDSILERLRSGERP